MVSGFGAGEVILDHCNLHLCDPEMWGMVVRDSSQRPARHYRLSSPPKGLARSGHSSWPDSRHRLASSAVYQAALSQIKYFKYSVFLICHFSQTIIFGIHIW